MKGTERDSVRRQCTGVFLSFFLFFKSKHCYNTSLYTMCHSQSFLAALM